MPETDAAGLRRVTRRRALTSGNVAARAADLVPEQGALPILVPLCAVTSGRVLVSRTLAEQLPTQLHGRFPLTETDPPVGQDEP